MKTEHATGIKLLIVDDHPLVLEGLRACLGSGEHIENIVEAMNGEDAIAKARENPPDVVLMDISMPQMSGLAATRKLLATCPTCKVLILTMHENREYIAEAMRAGASGYVLKDTSPRELLSAIDTVHRGEKYFSSGVGRVVEEEPAPSGQALSARELQVLKRIADGLSNKEIAGRLSLSVRTIETHRERIMRKLGIHTVAGLTKYAIARGITTVE
jgi:two-component system, NarL family, nitrate/nitrite response regulator NarL